VPWAVFNEGHLRGTISKVFRDHAPGGKPKQQLYDYACCYEVPLLAKSLATEAGYDSANHFASQHLTVAARYLAPYAAKNIKDVLRQCDRHGVDHRNLMHQTSLMAAACTGNLPLVEALLERGAEAGQTDEYGRNALHWAMLEAFRDPKFANGPFAALYEMIAPSNIDLMMGGRLLRIDRHLSEYFLVQTMWALSKSQFHQSSWRDLSCFTTGTILTAWEHLPKHIVRPERNKRSHISSVLSRNEVERDYAYNRRLFKRFGQGRYQFNPQIAIRKQTLGGEGWLPIFAALNLPLIKECTHHYRWQFVDQLLRESGIKATAVPVIGELAHQQEQAKLEASIARQQEFYAEQERKQKRAAEAHSLARAAKAKRLALMGQQMVTKTAKKSGRGQQRKLWGETDIEDDPQGGGGGSC
jgi:hypothetical protein